MAEAISGPSHTELPFRFVWMRAVQDSDLKPTPTLVAYAFGQYVGADKRNPPGHRVAVVVRAAEGSRR